MKFYKNAAMVACVILIVTLAIIASVLIFDKSKISFSLLFQNALIIGLMGNI